MFRRMLLVLALLFPATLAAGPILELLPGAYLDGVPGDILQWSLKLTNDTGYIIPNSVDFVTTTPVGTFTPLSPLPYQVIGAAESWTVVFGTYTIDAGAAIGAAAIGSVVLAYDAFPLHPDDPLFNPDDGQFGLTVSRGAAINVVESASAVPEPSAVLLTIAGLAFLLARRRH